MSIREIIMYCPIKGKAIPDNQYSETPERRIQQMTGEAWTKSVGTANEDYWHWVDATVRKYIISGARWRDLRYVLMDMAEVEGL